MTRQAFSGGFAQSTARSYPVYLSFSSPSAPVSAVINTGPSFNMPEDTDIWAFGPHVLVFPHGLEAEVDTTTTFIIPTDVNEHVLGFRLVTATGIPGDPVYVPVEGFLLTLGYGTAISINWGAVAPSPGEGWTEVGRGGQDNWVPIGHGTEEEWTRIRRYA